MVISRGTESLLTLRWRKTDANRRYCVTRLRFEERLMPPPLDSPPTENSARTSNRSDQNAGCLQRDQWFESRFLQRRVGSTPVPTSVDAHRLDEQEVANWRGGRNAVSPSSASGEPMQTRVALVGLIPIASVLGPESLAEHGDALSFVSSGMQVQPSFFASRLPPQAWCRGSPCRRPQRRPPRPLPG